MKKILALLMVVGFVMSFGGSVGSAKSKTLVAYFSRAGQEYAVGNIRKGNTAILAEMIAQKTGADLFEIKPVKPYPDSYEECTKVASAEKSHKARPEFVGKVENFSDYDTIFVGYPIWYGDMPMIVYTFLESQNFSGKKIVPFCTHGSSGLSSTDQNIELTCPDAKVLRGFEIRGTTARNDSAQTEAAVDDWLSKLDL